MIWQLAVQTSSSDYANQYGTSTIYPNTDDPLKSSETDIEIPKARKKKMTTKERVLSILLVIVVILLVILLSYAYRNKWVQDKFTEIREHTSNRIPRMKKESTVDTNTSDWLSS